MGYVLAVVHSAAGLAAARLSTNGVNHRARDPKNPISNRLPVGDICMANRKVKENLVIKLREPALNAYPGWWMVFLFQRQVGK